MHFLNHLTKYGIALAIIFLMTSCGYSRPCGKDCTPTVFVTKSPIVWEYNIECPCDDNQSCGVCEKGNKSITSFTEIGADPDYEPLIDSYNIAIGDVLEISVFGDEDTLVDNVIVAPDGKIYYLNLDGFVAEGKSIEDISDIIANGVSDLFLAPSVTVIPRVMSQQSFTILGRVQHPGLYPLERTVTLRQAVGLAGGILYDPEYVGLATDAGTVVSTTNLNDRSVTNLKDSFIVRGGEKLSIDFDALINTADNSQNITVRAGDYIYLAADDSREIYVMGQVRAPTALGYDDDMTLIGALTAAGGWTTDTPYSADPRRVLLVRGCLECPTACLIDVREILAGHARDIYLQPGDILYVHQKKFAFGRELIRLALLTYVQSFVDRAASHYVNEHWFE